MVLVDLGFFLSLALSREWIGIDSYYLGNRLFDLSREQLLFWRYIFVFFIFGDIDTTTDIMGGGPALTRQEVAKV